MFSTWRVTRGLRECYQYRRGSGWGNKGWQGSQGPPDCPRLGYSGTPSICHQTVLGFTGTPDISGTPRLYRGYAGKSSGTPRLYWLYSGTPSAGPQGPTDCTGGTLGHLVPQGYPDCPRLHWGDAVTPSAGPQGSPDGPRLYKGYSGTPRLYWGYTGTPSTSGTPRLSQIILGVLRDTQYWYSGTPRLSTFPPIPM